MGDESGYALVNFATRDVIRMVVTVDYVTDRLIRYFSNLGEASSCRIGAEGVGRNNAIVGDNKDIAVKTVSEVINVRR